MEKKPVVFLNEPRVITITSCRMCPGFDKETMFCGEGYMTVYNQNIIQIWCPLEKKKK